MIIKLLGGKVIRIKHLTVKCQPKNIRSQSYRS